MTPDELQGNYAAHLWSWDWIGRPIGIHPGIRPADLDGWIHQCGEMLILEGKVTSTLPELSIPQMNAVREMGNVTALLIHTDAAHWLDNRPTRLLGYRIYRSRSFPWQGEQRYQQLPGCLEDEDTLRTVINIVCVWCGWAGTRAAA